MEILVTGATGFIGRRLVLLLSQNGHGVRVLTRDARQAEMRLPVHCRIIEWNPGTGPVPEAALEGVQAVVHLAGAGLIARWNEETKREIVESRVRSTHHLVRALQAMENPPEVLVSASGVGVYGDRGDETLDENSGGGGHSFLAELCHKWEMEALQARSAGVRTALLRTGVVLGTDGGALARMLPPFRLGLGGRLGSGRQWMSWIHVQDLARLILHIIETPQLEGPINAVGPEPVTNAAFSAALGRAVRRPAFWPIPEAALKLLAGEAAEVLLASQRVFPEKALGSGFRFEFPELAGALERLCDQRTHELLLEQWVPRPLEEVFEFFSDAGNLEVLTPPHLRFRVLSQSTPQIEEGMRINYRLQLHGVPFRWQSMIMDWRPPTRFSDVQVLGPYRLWHHTHDFIAQAGGTLLRDRAIYRVPFGTLGDLFVHPFVRRDLERIFAFRRDKIGELFGS